MKPVRYAKFVSPVMRNREFAVSVKPLMLTWLARVGHSQSNLTISLQRRVRIERADLPAVSKYTHIYTK